MISTSDLKQWISAASTEPIDVRELMSSTPEHDEEWTQLNCPELLKKQVLSIRLGEIIIHSI